ncbi:MAG TPA: hypothetical protein VGF31_01110 [Myxococcaceae bacterium]
MSEPIEPELVLPAEPDPIVEELPVPLVLGVVPVVPVVPPLVEPPVCAKAAPAASIEIIANRFHHVFMRNTLRFGRTVVALLHRGGCVLSGESEMPPSGARSEVGRSREPLAGTPDVGT